MISELLRQQDQFFEQGKTKPIRFRKKALLQLQKAILTNEDAICDALYQDFKKPKFESLATETQFVLAELKDTLKNLEFWARPKKVKSSLSNFPSSDRIYFEPYGRVLVISPWNYPFMLALTPVIGAIAAGNTVTIKPSELTPNTSSIISKIITEAFDMAHVTVVEGGVDTAQELLGHRWGYIFFTGSTRVGKIIYQRAAEKLTPVTLELGGKNPCIIDETANIKLAAKRIAWGKFLNAGQTCIASDYVLVHHSVKDMFIATFKKVLRDTYGENPENSTDFARIITKAHYERLVKMTEGETVLYGGQYNPKDNFVSPTLLDNPALDSPVMEGEIFGPVLPIIAYQDEEDIKQYLSKYKQPLGLYIFSNRKSFQKRVIATYSFGGGAINDTVIQITNKSLPFGGVGNSGIGGYHGKHSFELFSHKKSIIKKSNWLDIPLRYAPYNLKESLVKKFKHLI